MKIYIRGTLSVPQKFFLPAALFFSNDEAEYTDLPSDNCLGIEGVQVESRMSDDNLAFTTRWKGASLYHEPSDELTECGKLLEKIRKGSMRLRNIEAYFDSDVNVNITEVVFRTEDGDTVLDGTLLDDEPIEMIAD